MICVVGIVISHCDECQSQVQRALHQKPTSEAEEIKMRNKKLNTKNKQKKKKKRSNAKDPKFPDKRPRVRYVGLGTWQVFCFDRRVVTTLLYGFVYFVLVSIL